MITWHGFSYGYDADNKDWYVTNIKTGETFIFCSFEDADRFVETHRA